MLNGLLYFKCVQAKVIGPSPVLGSRDDGRSVKIPRGGGVTGMIVKLLVGGDARLMLIYTCEP